MASGNNNGYEKKRSKNNSNIQSLLPAQEHFHLHFSALFFILILIYIIIYIFNFYRKEDTGVYDVVEGSSGKVSEYTAFVIRDEQVFNASHSGFANFYASQGERVRVDSTVCTLDENGNFLSQLITSSNSLSDDSMKKLKNSLYTLSVTFDLNDYSSLYTEKNVLKNELLSLLTDDSITENRNPSDEYTFDVIETPVSGTFATGFDGYENFDITNFDKSQLNVENYNLNMVRSGDLVSAGTPLFKIISSDSFSIIIEMTEEDQVDFWFEDTIDVYFKDYGKTISGKYTKIMDNSGNRYARIDFTDCGFLFVNTRFTSIEIGTNVVKGLKVPSSALVTKDYFLLPKEYLFESGSINDEPVCMLQYYEDGELKIDSVPFSIVDNYDDKYYIISSDFLKDGDTVLSNDDTGSIYVLGAKKAVKGVYCINKGYAVFKKVNILEEMEEGYVIIEQGINGSLVKNDRIALNGNMITEGEIVY